MRAVVQRVSKAKVEINGKINGEIGKGFLIFVAVHRDDEISDIDYLAKKIENLRVFEDEDGKMNLSIQDIRGELLVVSQFTLYGDCRKGNRPSFIQSAKSPKSIDNYETFLEKLRSTGLKVETGEFGADMDVSLVNDGPVTIQLDSSKIY